MPKIAQDTTDKQLLIVNWRRTMKNKKKIIAFTSIILLLILGIFLYKSFSTPKLAELDPSWGMGTRVTKSVSNDRSYEWYVDQWSTGRNAALNCGPSSMAMVAKWLDEDTTINTEDIADKYIPDEAIYNGVHTLTLAMWLDEYGINSRWLDGVSEEALIKELDEGNIIIVGLDTKYLTYNSNNKQRVGEYFCIDPSKNTYHYVIAKGYKVVDDKLYFETYDPGSYYILYEDGKLIGKDRYYLGSEFIEAANMYFPDVLVFEE